VNKHLHIICLNVPYPVDYGGVFDLFYKLPALQQQGVKIHLHCFVYGRKEQPILHEFCESVDYYNRETGLHGLSLKYPYIVNSRRSNSLLNRLQEDDYPILMEGTHCTYLLNDKRFKRRHCFVRLHNVEHIYYRNLYENATSVLKKLYFYRESKMLAQYEKQIAKKAVFWSVTEKDAEIYRQLGYDNQSLPLFLPDWKVKAMEGKGTFCLYHGDLSVDENEKAATWLIENIFNHLEIPFIIAGKNPPQRIINLIQNKPTYCLIANPDEAEMQDLIAKAHINIIPSFNSTGIKLKLVNALFNGRYCVVNKATAEGSGLEKLCYIAADANEFKSVITHLYAIPFDNEDIHARRLLLDNMFNNAANAKQMVQWIFVDHNS